MPLEAITVIQSIQKGGGDKPSPFNFLTLLSLVVSSLSLILSFVAAYRNKRIDVITKQFDKLCIEPVETSFKALDKLFSENSDSKAVEYRQQIAAKLTEVNLVMASLVKVYPVLQTKALTDLTDGFSERFFESEDECVSDYLADYLRTKNVVLENLFRYVLREELRFKFWKLRL